MENNTQNLMVLGREELVEIGAGYSIKDYARAAGALAAMTLHDALDFARGMWDEL